LIPLTRFQASARPSRAVPTPADHSQLDPPLPEDHLPPDGDAGELARPAVSALPVGAERLDRFAVAERELDPDVAGGDADLGPSHLDLAAPPGERPLRAFAELAALTVPDAPKGHLGRAHLDHRREQERLLGEGTDPAPALAKAAAPPQRHPLRWNRQQRALVRGPAPGEPRDGGV
jgi:hypothetical protein